MSRGFPHHGSLETTGDAASFRPCRFRTARMRLFLHIGGSFCGCPHDKSPTILGLYRGPLIFWKLPKYCGIGEECATQLPEKLELEAFGIFVWPRGFKYLNSEYFAQTTRTIPPITQSPYYIGIWTLRVGGLLHFSGEVTCRGSGFPSQQVHEMWSPATGWMKRCKKASH